MSDTTQTRRAFFEQVAGAYDGALESVSEALLSQEEAEILYDNAKSFATLRAQLDPEGREALAAVISESLLGFAHSFFAILDGAQADTEEELVSVTNHRGESLGEGLHEHWVSHLFDTGRQE